jgi:hypothetical protein
MLEAGIIQYKEPDSHHYLPFASWNSITKLLTPLPPDRASIRAYAFPADSKEPIVVTLPWVLRLESPVLESDNDLPSALSSVNFLSLEPGSLGSLKTSAV